MIKVSSDGVRRGSTWARSEGGLCLAALHGVADVDVTPAIVISYTQVCSLESSVTDLHCSPSGSKKQQGSTEVFAVACADGEVVDQLQDETHNPLVRHKRNLMRCCRLPEAHTQQRQA